MKLAENVNLYLVKEDKFKTVQIMFRFREPLKRENFAMRTLLSNIITVANQKYPSQKAFQTAQAMNYGMRVLAGVSTKGQENFFSLRANIVDPKLAGEDTLKKALEFLKEMLENPLTEEINGETALNAQIFQLEKANLTHYLESIKEDHASYASLEADRLFYSNPNLQLPVVGNLELLEKTSPQGIYQYFQELKANNPLDIIILGNLTEEEVEQDLAQLNWQFTDRPAIKESPFYSQETKDFEVQVKEIESYQSQLVMAWQEPIQYADDDYMALQIFNGLFGGQANSKLFSIVREKESLAYSIVSELNSFTGQLKVLAGIDQKDYQKARDLILSLLEEMKNGQFTQADLEQTRALIRNNYLAGLESPASLIENAYIQKFVPDRALSREEWLSRLEAVSAEDVQRAAEKQILQTEYFLKGNYEA